MGNAAYVEGVIGAAMNRLHKAQVPSGIVDQFDVDITHGCQVEIEHAEGHVGPRLDSTIESYCTLIAVGRAYLEAHGSKSAAEVALREEFVRLEKFCLNGARGKAAHQSHQKNRDAREHARKLAHRYWAAGHQDNLSGMARTITKELTAEAFVNRSGENYRDTTVRKWIRPLVPPSLKRNRLVTVDLS